MKIKTLIKKITSIDIYSKEEKKNLVVPSLMMDSDIRVIAYHTVDFEEVMRPDLIALDRYGDSSKLDLILKFNSISNPFSIKEGDILLIPNKDDAQIKYKSPKKIKNNPRSQFTDSKRLSKEDAKRKDFLSKNSAKRKNGSSENLPPNMLKSNEESIKFSKKKILLGANMNTKKQL